MPTVVRVIILTLAAMIIALALWWTQVFTSPERAYNGMLVNNLTTSSVTKSELATSGEQSALQRVTLNLGAVNAARWLVTITQGKTAVTTESIGTPNGGYVRYVEIKGQGKQSNFDRVLNVWAKGTKQEGSSLQDLFSQAVLDVGSAPVPPIGNPPADIRRSLLKYINAEKVFTPDYKSVKSEVINGRQVYSLTVSVKLAPYLKMMQSFANVYGLTTLQDINPTEYQAAAPLKLTISIDKTAHTMLRVAYQPANFVETYSDYGIRNSVNLPDAKITTQELQKRLQSAND